MSTLPHISRHPSCPFPSFLSVCTCLCSANRQAIRRSFSSRCHETNETCMPVHAQRPHPRPCGSQSASVPATMPRERCRIRSFDRVTENHLETLKAEFSEVLLSNSGSRRSSYWATHDAAHDAATCDAATMTPPHMTPPDSACGASTSRRLKRSLGSKSVQHQGGCNRPVRRSAQGGALTRRRDAAGAAAAFHFFASVRLVPTLPDEGGW